MKTRRKSEDVEMDDLVRVMKALSDPGRVRVLKLLRAGELCACEIIRGLGLAQPTVSRHMRVLADAGLVRPRKAGAWVRYSLAGEEASLAARAMLALLDGWLEDDEGVLALRAAVADRLAPLDKPLGLGHDEASASCGARGPEAGRHI